MILRPSVAYHHMSVGLFYLDVSEIVVSHRTYLCVCSRYNLSAYCTLYMRSKSPTASHHPITGLCDGKVVHHSFIEKTVEEVKAVEEKRKEKQKLKDQRQKQQNTNINKKKKSEEEHKKRCLEGMGTDGEKVDDAGEDGEDDNNNEDDEEFTSDEDDAEYFR